MVQPLSQSKDMDRKALARSCKTSRRPMGVYCIRNLRNGLTLIGRSTDLPSLLNREQASLRFGGHPNARLQHDWNAFGPEAFAFEALDTLEWPDDSPSFDPTADLLLLERMWRERLQSNGEGNYATRTPQERA